MKVLVAQSCLTLCDPMDCSPPGSSVHGILQARRLEWVAMPSSREGFYKDLINILDKCLVELLVTDKIGLLNVYIHSAS